MVTAQTNGSSVGGGQQQQPVALLTYRDVRRLLRCSQSTVQKLVKSGQLKSVPIRTPGSERLLRRFDPADVDAYLAATRAS